MTAMANVARRRVWFTAMLVGLFVLPKVANAALGA
jgi:hypothetical protein